MRSIRPRKIGLFGLAGFALLAVSGVAQAPASALADLQAGLWQLRSIGGGTASPTRTICMRDPNELLQLRHGARSCTRRVLSSAATEITVRYECGGAGWGQTLVRVETPRLARVDTQGIDQGSPFHHTYEARRTGSCS